MILSNPPFGASIKSKEVKYIKEYQLGVNDDKQRPTQKSEVLFIERCIKLAKKGTGKIAIVLPEGVMTNSSLQYVRDYILDNCELLASISLPESAFSHFGAGIKSSILFLRRKKDKEKLRDYKIFMAVAKQVGIDSTGREETNELFSDKSECIYNQWHSYQKKKGTYKRTKNCFTIKLSEINKEGPFNATRYVWKPTFNNATDRISAIADMINDKVTPSSKENKRSSFALIRMDELPNNPVKVENIIYCPGSDIEGSLKVVQEGDILLARLGPSMLNRKIVVVPSMTKNVDYVIASPEFLVIRPKDPKDAFYITGVLRTNLMLNYMYSKTRGGTPSRYRLNEADFMSLDFPISDKKNRKEKSKLFEKSLKDYHASIQRTEDALIKSHNDLENNL